jgi:Uma2 family endonuclease
MVPVGAERRYTVEDYFSVEESSAIKHEFCAGQIFAMAGASVRHNRITGNVFAALRAALAERGCEVFASDLRVRTPSGLYTFPDVTVVCGGVQLSATDRLDTVTNPALLVEVLSESTAAYDRGEKFRHYQSLAALREYLVIDQSAIHVEHYSVEDEGRVRSWRRQDHSNAGDVVSLSSLGIAVTLADIYAGVTPASPPA